MEKKQREWVEFVASQREALIENRSPPHLLYRLALIYFGLSRHGGQGDGPARILESLSGNADLSKVVLAAFRGVTERRDLPAPAEILRIRHENKIPILGLPILAGLAERDRCESNDVSQWSEIQVQRALLLRFTAHWGETEPDWYERLLQLRTAEFAEALRKFCAMELRSRRTAGGLIWSLAQDQTYAEVARLVCLPLLRAFPTRCSPDQLLSLTHLLQAAIRHADPVPLRKLIEQKLTRKSMNRTQRIRWLVAARTAFGADFQADLEASVAAAKDDSGVRQLVRCFYRLDLAPFPIKALGVRGTEWLFRLFGGLCAPTDAYAGGLVSEVHEASRLATRLIEYLKGSPDKEASRALARLAEEPEMAAWQKPLRRALQKQRTVRCDAEYQHPSMKQVEATLNSGPPANAADLAALAIDRLRVLAQEIGQSNTNDWQQYWNLDRHARATDRRHETACRDALLYQLRRLLPAEVQAEPEAQRANRTQADIALIYNGFRVPVEVKANDHRELWSAPKNQLIDKYAPEGPGIYLVLWFGAGATQPPPEGSKPKRPDELEARLKAQAPDEDRNRIHVCVIDVAKPED